MSFKNIYWILGGISKKADKLKLQRKYFKNIRAYIYGKNKKFFYNELKNKIDAKIFSTLNVALKNVLKDSKKNINKENIIFSPSAASFDQ